MGDVKTRVPAQYDEHEDGANWYIVAKVPFMQADSSNLPLDEFRYFPKCQTVKSPVLINVQIEPQRIVAEIRNQKTSAVYYVERTTQYPLLVDQCRYGVKDFQLMFKLTRQNENIPWKDYLGLKADSVCDSIDRITLEHEQRSQDDKLILDVTVNGIVPMKQKFGRCQGAENAFIDFDVEPYKITLELRMLPFELHKSVHVFERHTNYPLSVEKCSYEVALNKVMIKLKREKAYVPWANYFR